MDYTATLDPVLSDSPRQVHTKKKLGSFERYLTVWVALCMVAGVLLGKALQSEIDS